MNPSRGIPIIGSMHGFLSGVLKNFYWGSVTIIETNELKAVHRGLHHLMIESLQQGMHIQLVDVANMFNPHLISSIDRTQVTDDVLKNITLARPFQQLQSLSIFRKLISDMLHHKKNNQLVIVTGLDNQITDNEDKKELLEQLQYILSGLQNVAVRGNVVVLTNHRREDYSGLFTSKSSVHVIIEEKRVILEKHPFLSKITVKRV